MSIPIWVTDPTGNNNPYLKILNGAFVVGSKGQQLGPGDYYTSSDGVNWTSHIGGLTVADASFADGNSGVIAGNLANFIISFGGSGSYAPATHKIELLISVNGGTTFSLSSMVGFTSGSNSALFNYYDAMPVSGNNAFRLALTNQAQTITTYMSSYDGTQTWVNEGTSKPSFWGPVPIQSYAKGTYQGSPFYVAAVPNASGNIYGGTTKPTLPITNIPAGWNLLFTVLNGGGAPHMAANVPGHSDTVFVVNDSATNAPAIVAGTGNASTWKELALSGSLLLTSGVSSDTTTLVYS